MMQQIPQEWLTKAADQPQVAAYFRAHPGAEALQVAAVVAAWLSGERSDLGEARRLLEEGGCDPVQAELVIGWFITNRPWTGAEDGVWEQVHQETGDLEAADAAAALAEQAEAEAATRTELGALVTNLRAKLEQAQAFLAEHNLPEPTLEQIAVIAHDYPRLAKEVERIAHDLAELRRWGGGR